MNQIILNSFDLLFHIYIYFLQEPTLVRMESPQDWDLACPNTPRGICFLTFISPSNENHARYLDTFL